jgi:hypothetical protein
MIYHKHNIRKEDGSLEEVFSTLLMIIFMVLAECCLFWLFYLLLNNLLRVMENAFTVMQH